MTTHSVQRTLAVLALHALVWFPAAALPTQDPGNPDDGQMFCLPDFKVSGQPRLVGFPLVGQQVTIDGRHVKLINAGDFCDRFSHPLAAGQFQWVFVFPPGSAGMVEATSTLQPRMTLDVVGSYLAELTVCPLGCTVTASGAGTPSLTVELPAQPPRQVQFVTTSVLSPETVPMVPDFARVPVPKTRSTEDERDAKCLNAIPGGYGPGFFNPQWVTHEEFDGPSDYAGGDFVPGEVRAVEGVVSKTKISRKDGPLNHWSQDFNSHLAPDPWHRWVLLQLDPGEKNQELLGVEWENEAFTGSYSPSNGDRASVFGYWIHDCGHAPWLSEIHPPVGIAVHRQRAIRIPDNAVIPELAGPVGSVVWVPGILTEVYFNPRAGKMMNCNGKGLHEPGRILPPPPGSIVPIPIEGDCLEDPSPLAGSIYSFNIYLPRNAKTALEAAEVMGLPDLPLYYAVIEDGPNPLPVEIDRRSDNGIDYLHVKVDLRSFSNQIQQRQTIKIVSAWVYPSSDNWQLRRWGVEVDSLTVRNDSDGAFRGKGEWNMWFHVNNASPETSKHEWTQIVHESVTDHTFEFGPAGTLIPVGPPLPLDFDGRPWSTGSGVQADRNLGPDLLLFPGQRIQLHTSGFEKDFTTQDSLALVEDLRMQQAGQFAGDNVCKDSNDIDSLIYSGCADYDLNYSIIDRGFVGGSTLSAAAEELMSFYTFGGGPGGCPGDDDVCPGVIVEGDLPAPEQDLPWHPVDQVALADDPVNSIHDTTIYRPQGIELLALTETSVARFYEAVTLRQEADPDDVADMLTELREAADQALEEIGPEVLLDVQVICAALPPSLCTQYFGDLSQPEPPADATRRRMTGSAKLGQGPDRTNITLSVHCHSLRRPNQLNVRWGNGNRFEMKLMTTALCEEAPAPMQTHSGWGLGALNGTVGAKANWTFEDHGEPGAGDHIRIDVYDADNQIVHSVSGTLDNGNVQAHEADGGP